MDNESTATPLLTEPTLKAVTLRMPLDLYNELHDQAIKRLLSDNIYIVHVLDVIQKEKRRKSNVGSKVDKINA